MMYSALQVVDKRSGMFNKLSPMYEQYLKVPEEMRGWGIQQRSNTGRESCIQLRHLLFTKVSSEIISMEVWAVKKSVLTKRT